MSDIHIGDRVRVTDFDGTEYRTGIVHCIIPIADACMVMTDDGKLWRCWLPRKGERIEGKEPTP